MDYKIVSQHIDVQEHKDAFIVASMLRDLLLDKVENLYFTETAKGTHYDLIALFDRNGRTYRIAIEIKERNKSYLQMIKYPNSELKDLKYQDIMRCTKEFDSVYYILLVNQSEAHIYSLRNIDWSKVETSYWNIRNTQYNIDSSYSNSLTHFIPYSEGKTILFIDKYYKIYNKMMLELLRCQQSQR